MSSIKDKIEDLWIFDFSDGFLGSTCHCVGYYHGSKLEDVLKWNSEMMASKELDEEYWYWNKDEEDDYTWDELFEELIIGLESNVEVVDELSKIEVDIENKKIILTSLPYITDNEDNEMYVFVFDEDGNMIKGSDYEKVVNNVNDYIMY